MLQLRFKLDRREIAERRAPAPSIVPPFHKLHHLTAGRGTRRPDALQVQLDLQRREEALHHRIVPTIARATHAARHARIDEPLAIRPTCELGGFNRSSQHLS